MKNSPEIKLLLDVFKDLIWPNPLSKLKPLWLLEKQYLEAGVNFARLKNEGGSGIEEWRTFSNVFRLECEYGQRGYRCIPTQAFFNHVRHKSPLKNHLRIILAPDEEFEPTCFNYMFEKLDKKNVELTDHDGIQLNRRPALFQSSGAA